MPLTPEQQRMRYTRQRILKALNDEPFGYASEQSVRGYAGKHAAELFDTALSDLITEGYVARAGADNLELGTRFYVEQERKRREERKAARDAARAANTKKGARR